MHMTTKLYQLAEQQGIQVQERELFHPVQAAYFSFRSHSPLILLSSRLRHDPPLYRCVFAEELGHHFTSCGDSLPHKHYRYHDRLNITRVEHRALLWAAQYLIPSKDLFQALQKDIREDWELAEHFVVTKEMIHFRLQMTDVKKLFT
jgi:Zn-dependent peptidase ImmA (M78 family)